MTKKYTTIFKIIAGLTILILGALLVYSLIPSSATNSPDKNQEPPKRSIAEKKPLKSEANASSQGQMKGLGLPWLLLAAGGLSYYICYFGSRFVAIVTNDQNIVVDFKKTWGWLILFPCALGLLGFLIDRRGGLKSYVAKPEYVYNTIEVIVKQWLLGISIIACVLVLGGEVAKKIGG